ncbi:MAG: LytR/AlgR family response regulator transcription factor [Spirosomataceae bacterium]
MAELPTSHIVYLEASKNYTIFVFSDGKKKLSTTTLGKHEADLCEDCFIRTHRSFVINRGYIERFELDSKTGWIILKNGKMIPISRRRLPKVSRLVLNHAPQSN